jgi:phosphoesterase RecJ-like protein
MTERDRALIEMAARTLRPHLDAASRAAVCTHVNPDGDGIGAEICLHRYLRGRGIESRIINTEPLTPRYLFLDPDGAVETFDRATHDAYLRGVDLLFVLDNSAVSRLGSLEASVRGTRARTICIDHHNVVDPFWNVNIVDEEACATGELVFQIIRALGGAIDAAAARAAYVSLVTDTGYFRFSKTSPRCHEAAADLLRAGVDPPRVYEEVFERNSPALIRLQGAALSGLGLEEEGRLAHITLTRRQVVECGAADEDTSEIVNGLLAIDGVRMAVMFKELGERRVKLSFRSKGGLDVNRLAARYGGGGHTNAAGAVLDGTLEETRGLVLAACRDLLAQAA